MGEFVEHSIESLLSTFEEIGDVQLLSKEELNVFIKRCRQYEYRLNKHEKTPRDFNLFAEYLCDFLTLLKSRRKKLQYYHKKELIERPIRKKVASIYRRAADRFQGNWTQWEKLIKFLKKNKMRRELSAAYTRALQIYGKNESLRSEFALWQFFEAASPQNARTQTLAAIRLFPRSPTLYVTLFSIEIHFVDKVLKRRKFITEGKSKENQSDKIEIRNEDENDHITNLNVAKVVVEQALSSVPVHDAPGMLVEMWKECGKVKLVPNVEKIRLFIEDRLNEFNNEHTRLFEIELGCNEGASKFDMFDKALKKTPSEMMHRFYLQWLREIPRDAFVEFKIREVLHELCENGWMNETDWSDLENEIRHIQEQYGANFIKKCLKKRPQSVVLWDIYLENCLRDGTMFPDEFRAQCNTALEKVDPNDSFPIWRHAIEYTITSDPRQIEHVFNDAMKYTNTNVSSKIKLLLVEYLDGLLKEEKITAREYRERIMKLINSKPNSADLYCTIHCKELERAQPDYKFAGFVIKSAVYDRDCASVEAVILYAKWALTHEPTNFHIVQQIGLKLFEGALLDEFMIKWTQLLQGSSEIFSEHRDLTSEAYAVKTLEKKEEIQASGKYFAKENFKKRLRGGCKCRL